MAPGLCCGAQVAPALGNLAPQLAGSVAARATSLAMLGSQKRAEPGLIGRAVAEADSLERRRERHSQDGGQCSGAAISHTIPADVQVRQLRQLPRAHRACQRLAAHVRDAVAREAQCVEGLEGAIACGAGKCEDASVTHVVCAEQQVLEPRPAGLLQPLCQRDALIVSKAFAPPVQLVLRGAAAAARAASCRKQRGDANHGLTHADGRRRPWADGRRRRRWADGRLWAAPTASVTLLRERGASLAFLARFCPAARHARDLRTAPDMADADSDEPHTLESLPSELLRLVAAACTDVRCLASFAAACTVCSASAHGELRAALPASIKVGWSSLINDNPWFESSGHVLFQTATSLNAVKAMASLVWSTMKKDPGLYALTPALCQRLEKSTELLQIDVIFRESTPPPTYAYKVGSNRTEVVPVSAVMRNYATRLGPVDMGPYSYTTDETSAAGANSGDRQKCIIVLRHDDCPLFVRSSLMHELTTGFRRLIHWRSVEDGFPALAPWTRDAEVRTSARDELVASLRSQELWGSMMLDKICKGLHVGSVTEHKLNGGIVVSMLLSGRDREDLSLAFAFPALAFLGDADAQALYLPSVHEMSYALIITRTQDEVGGLGPWDAATFTGWQVLPTDTDIDAVRKRPLLTWKAPRACARFRNAQCCLSDPPGVRPRGFCTGCTGI